MPLTEHEMTILLKVKCAMDEMDDFDRGLYTGIVIGTGEERKRNNGRA